VSGSSSPPRFRIRLEDGSEIPVSSVEALARRVGRGDLLPDSPLFDAGIGGWQRASDIAVVRFIIEEMVREFGTYPDGWSPESITGTPAVDARSGREGEPPNIDLSGFTVVEDVEPREEEGGTPAINTPGWKSGSRALDFTLEELPGDIDSYPPPPPSDELVGGTEIADEWLQRALGGGLENSPPSPAHPPASERGSAPTASDYLRQKRDPGYAPTERLKRDWGLRRFLPLSIVGILVIWGIWYWSDRVEHSVSYLVEVGNLQRPVRVLNTSLPFIEIPEPAPPPEGLEGEVASAVEGVRERIGRFLSAMRRESGAASAPPSEWLTGYYMANASEFASVPAFWESYRQIVEELHRREESVFLALLAEEVGRHEQTDPNRARVLHDYLLSRWETALPARDALYGNLALTADSAIELHEFLEANQESLRYTPAVGPQVPNDPVLEVEATDSDVDAGLKRRLDRVLMALDRSRTDRVSVMDGIEAALFAAVERF
jgi:hypothetical protein